MNASVSPTPSDAPVAMALPIKEIESQQLELPHQPLEATFESSLRLCYHLINAFDPLLGAQAQMVADICSKMADPKYFSETERKAFIAAAWLHDIGLIGFDQSLLHKLRYSKETLTANERATYHQHPIRGQELAAFVPENIKGLGETIRAHHELFNGMGFPDSIAGETIPWTARCLAVAVYFAECGQLRQQALDRILEQSGTSFDPDAVRLFFKMTQGADLPGQLKEVMVDELTPGMQLAKGLCNAAGLLLVPEKQPLTDATIAKIKNYNLLSLVRERLLVMI